MSDRRVGLMICRGRIGLWNGASPVRCQNRCFCGRILRANRIYAPLTERKRPTWRQATPRLLPSLSRLTARRPLTTTGRQDRRRLTAQPALALPMTQPEVPRVRGNGLGATPTMADLEAEDLHARAGNVAQHEALEQPQAHAMSVGRLRTSLIPQLNYTARKPKIAREALLPRVDAGVAKDVDSGREAFRSDRRYRSAWPRTHS